MPIMQNKCSPITHPKLLNPKFSMNIGTEKNNTDNVNMLDKFSKLYFVLKWIILKLYTMFSYSYASKHLITFS